MGEYDISFKAFAEKLPELAVSLFGPESLGEAAVVQAIERELEVPLTAVDQAFVVEIRGQRCVVHLEAEVGFSGSDHRAVVKRSDMLDAKYDLPVWTTIVLMSRWRGPVVPPERLRRKRGSRMVTVRPRYVKLWEMPATRLVEGDVTALPWVAAMKASPEELDRAILRIRGVEDRELREQLRAEMTALAYLQYDEEEVAEIRRRLSMVTSKDILEATPLAEEFREYGRKEGREEGREYGRKEGREETLLDVIRMAIESRDPGGRVPEWIASIHDSARLQRIIRDLLRAKDAGAVRAILAKHRRQ